MGNTRFLLKEVQHSYASLLDLSIMMINHNGELQNEPAYISELSKVIYAKGDFLKEISKQINRFSSIDQSSIIDSMLSPYIGLKWIITPIKINESNEYFLITGPFIENVDVKQMILNRLVTIDFDEQYIQSIEQTKIIDIEKRQHNQPLSQLSAFIKEILEREVQLNLYTLFLDAMKIIHSFEKIDNQTLPTIAEEIYSHYKSSPYIEQSRDLSLVGLATLQSDNELQISFCKGNNSELLLGQNLYIGEGFLGHAVTREEPIVWDEIANDPRGIFFTQFGVHLIQLLCIPIRNNEKIYGVIFVGYSKQYSISNHTKYLLINFANQLAKEINLTELKTENRDHKLILNLSKELIKIIGNHSLQEKKQLIYILDLFREFTELKEISLVYKNQDGDLTYISRANQYELLLNIYHKYQNRSVLIEKNRSQLPIYIDEELFGVIIFGGRHDQIRENEGLLLFCKEVILEFLTNSPITKMGEVQNSSIDEEMLKKLEQDEEQVKNIIHHITNIKPTIQALPLSKREKEVLYFVLEGLTNQEVGEELFISTHTVKNHLTNIFKKLNVQDRNEAFALVYRIKYENS